MKKIKYIGVISLIVLFYFYVISIQIFAEEPEIFAEAGIIYSIETGEILYQKNITKRLYPASITKILTALISIENGNFNDLLTFTKESVALEPGSSNLGISSGEILNLEQSLYGLMLHSANEIANQLADYVSRKLGISYSRIVSNKLKEIGCTDTKFTNPSGLHDDDHYTTALDMAKIGTAAFNNPTLRSIIKTQKFIVPETNKSKEKEIYNSHKMIFKNSIYYHKSVIGGKTGFTGQAGNTLVTFAKINDMDLVFVILKSDQENIYKDTLALIKYAEDEYERQLVFSKNEVFETLVYTDEYGVDDSVYIKPEKDIYLYIKKNVTSSIDDYLSQNFNLEIDLPDKVDYNISENEPVGDIKIYQNDSLVAESILLASNELIININDMKIDFSLVYKILFALSLLGTIILIYFLVKLKIEERSID